MRKRLMRVFYVVHLFLASIAWGQENTILFDDFEDGSAEDGTPALWREGALTNGKAFVDGGDFILEPTVGNGLSWMVEIPHGNVSIRTQARLLENRSPTDSLGLWGRGDEDGVIDSYWAVINTNGQLYAGVGDGPGSTRSIVNTSLDPVASDVFLQLDLIDDQISFTAWSEDFPKPIEPQVSFSDVRNQEGALLGVVFANLPSPGGIHSPAVFRHFEVLSDSEPPAIGTPLFAGDADRDFDFDQTDLVRVQIAAKYLTDNAATWGEGDWNGAPGGSVEGPPSGNRRFDQNDIIAALAPQHYLTGPYAAIAGGGGAVGDDQTSIGYNPVSGEVFVDATVGVELTSINIDSASGIFIGDAAQNLGGSFDNDADANIFKATFGGSFGSFSFGNVAATGLSQEFVAGDLTVVGSLAGGGELGNVDLVFVPEPSGLISALCALIALVVLIGRTQ